MFKYICLFVLFLSACAPLENHHRKSANKPQVMQKDVVLTLDEEALRQNVIVKYQTKTLVSYRYKNVRVDEVSKLASRYCYNNGLNAYLRDVVLDKENYRVATFDCLMIEKK